MATAQGFPRSSHGFLRYGDCVRLPRVSSPSDSSAHSKTIGHLTALGATESKKRDAGQTYSSLLRDPLVRDQELSGTGARLSIASKTAAIAYRASVPSTKPHARIASETSSTSSVCGNASKPATDWSISCKTKSNWANRGSAMSTVESESEVLRSEAETTFFMKGLKSGFLSSIAALLLRSRECIGDRVCRCWVHRWTAKSGHGIEFHGGFSRFACDRSTHSRCADAVKLWSSRYQHECLRFRRSFQSGVQISDQKRAEDVLARIRIAPNWCAG
jgi:hypothetical protein